MRAVLVLATMLPVAASACLWDRDTLAFELKNRPDTQRALTGWFDRNPDKYYEMRIARIEADGTLDASQIDDVAVAYEKLGNTDKAIEVIERKSKLELDKHHRYTFHANRGTFFAHRWVAKRDPKDLERALADIRSAIKINPDAHFGREKAQLYVLEALSENKPIGEYVTEKLGAKDAERGLVGLVMLGSAWESPDIMAAIANTVGMEGNDAFVMELARARYQELVDNGRKPITPSAPKEFQDADKHGYMVSDVDALRAAFKALRKSADERHRGRTAYLVERLDQGRHPDTNANFWDEWKEPPLPEPPSPAQNPFAQVSSAIGTSLAILALPLLLVIITAVTIGTLIRRFRSK